MEQNILDVIKNAEMFLVGIGHEFSPAVEEEGSDFLSMCRKSKFYEEVGEDHEIFGTYDTLRSLIGVRPYFVVTMNTDDLIYRSSLEDDLIVAPCGSMGKLQCKEHIVDAKEIRDRVMETGDESLAVCPVCGQPLAFHTVSNPGYLEQGYLPQWEKYTKWLTCTLNRRLCILELGVGFSYPQVVRFPFEKTAFYNQKATLIRVNSKLPQLPEELAHRGISIRENPLQFLKEF